VRVCVCVCVCAKLGRLADVCRPCHQRYEVAVAKIMGHKMNAIVCETAEVARAAIDYLKAHRHQPETFLPLDYLQATAVDDRVRYGYIRSVLHYRPI
jgi:structural maintenance of chromosome 1